MKKYRVLVVVIILLVVLSTAEAGSGRSCTSEPQAGVRSMTFNDYSYALEQITFTPVCNGNPILVVSGNGDYSPHEVATGKVIGQGIGAISLDLGENFTGALTVS